MYGLINHIRNLLFDKGVLKTLSHDTVVISVGNLKAGGTGKTPFVEYLLRLLASSYNIAVISRGYGRKTKGYRLVDPQGRAEEFGDEPLQMAKKFPNVLFAVCESRNKAIEIIEAEYPAIDLVLLDDAYQHRYTARDFNILLTEYNRPFFKDRVLPFGLLREYRQGYKRADCIVVTKCPPLEERERKDFAEKLKPLPDQRIFFSEIHYRLPYLLNDESRKLNLSEHSVVLFTGISNNSHIVSYLKSKTLLLGTISYNDHHNFSQRDRLHILQEFRKLGKADSILLTTEKDAGRIGSFPIDVYVLPIDVEAMPYPRTCESLKTIINQCICIKQSNKRHNTSKNARQ